MFAFGCSALPFMHTESQTQSFNTVEKNHETVRIIETCEPDSKTPQTLPTNAIEFIKAKLESIILGYVHLYL